MPRTVRGGVTAGALSAGPPQLRKPATSIAKKGGYPASSMKRGYLYGVAPNNIQPTSCSVVIDNAPPLAGFSLPAGSGLILPAGTNEYQGQPFYGPWLMDPTTLKGGTAVLVDLDTMAVVSIQHTPGGNDYAGGNQSVGYVPSKAETLVGTHMHTGFYDSDGHMMPPPVGTSQLNYNNNPTTAPVISNVSGFTYSDDGKTTFDITLSFDTDQTNPDWLRAVTIYTVRHGDQVPTSGATTSHKNLTPSATGAYTMKLVNLGSNDDWDIYASYKEHTGKETPVALIATTSKTGISTPVITNVSAFTYTDAGNISFDVEFTVTADLNLPTCDVNFYTVRHGGTAPDANTTVHTKVASAANGTYDVKMKSLASGVSGGWDIYMSYRKYSTTTTPTLVGTLLSNPPNGTIQPMPTGIKSSGPTLTAFSVTRTRTTGGAQEMAYSFTETDFTSSVPSWCAGIEIVVRTDGATNPYHMKTHDPGESTSGVYTGSILGVAGTPHDIGVRYVSTGGTKSAIVWPSGGNNVGDPDGALLSSSSGGTLQYLRHHPAIQATIPSNYTSTGLDNIPDGTSYGRPKLTYLSSGNIIASSNTPFGSAVTQGADGAWMGMSSSGSATTQQLTIGAGHIIQYRCQFKLATAGSYAQLFILGNVTNGYGLSWNNGGAINIAKWVGGVRSNIGSLTTVTQDTNVHSITVTIVCVSSTSVSIEAAFDNQSPVLVTGDASLNLTAGTWPITIYDQYTGTGGTTKYWNFDIESDQPTYSSMPSQARTAVDSSGRLIGNIYDGTSTRTPANITALMDANSNLYPNPFGNTSGVVENLADATLSGFAPSVLSAQTIPTLGTIVLSADFYTTATSGTMELGIGNPSSTTVMYSLQWKSNGTVAVLRYSGGTSTAIATLSTTQSFQVGWNRLMIAVDYVNELIEAYLQPYNGSTLSLPAQVDSSGFLAFGPLTKYYVAHASAGSKIQNLNLGARMPYTGLPLAVAQVITIGGALQTNVVTSAAIQAGAVGSSELATGAVTNPAIASGAVGAGQIQGFTGSGSVSLDNCPDGTTYKRVNGQNLTNNNINTPFSVAASSCYIGDDGSISGLPNQTLTNTGATYPIVANMPITASGWLLAGGTTNNVFFLIGNQTNGLGFRWNASGTVSQITYKAGTATVGATVGTVTRDANYHWVSVKLTPGATPGTADTITIYFDANTFTGTYTGSDVTWGSRATVDVMAGGTAGSNLGQLLDFRVSSFNP